MYGGYNGMPDVGAEPAAEEGGAGGGDENLIANVEDEQQALVPLGDQVRRSTRIGRRPAYLDDYVTADSDEDMT